MKLYATVTSERATKGQGGKELMIEIMGNKKEVIARIKVMTSPSLADGYIIDLFPVSYNLLLDVKGHGFKLIQKGKKQKDNQCAICRKPTDGISCCIPL